MKFGFHLPYRKLKQGASPEPHFPVQGEIGHFGLAEWWLSTFSEQERSHIVDVYRPLKLRMSTDGDCTTQTRDESLIKGEISHTSQTVIRLLYGLATWFKSGDDRSIAYRMIRKAEEMICEATDVLDVHFLFNTKIEMYYRNRNIDVDALDMTIDACKKQIEVAAKAALAFKNEQGSLPLPTHRGYELLANIERRKGNFDSAVTLAKSALSQGWNGEWEKIIERCK